MPEAPVYTPAGSTRRRVGVMLALAWPSILEQILLTLTSFVDTAMVGSLGPAATAAVSVNITLAWLTGGLLMGAAVGFSVQVAQGVGAREVERTRAVLRQSVSAAFFCGGLLGLLLASLSHFLPFWLGAGADVLPGARSYLFFWSLGVPFLSCLNVFGACFRCMGNTRLPLVVDVGANLLNVVLNYFLIFPTREVVLFGGFTMPGAGMGVGGAALATALANAAGGLTLLLCLFQRENVFQIRRSESFRPDGAILRRAFSLGLPTSLERASLNLGQVFVTRVVATLGTAALAANHVAVTAEALCYLPAYGISAAATALVGQSVGAAEHREARSYGFLSAGAGFLLCTLTGAALNLFSVPLSSLFTNDPAVAREAAGLLRLISWIEPVFAVSIILSGALRGRGDTKFPAVMCLVSMWGLRVPLALLFVFRTGLGLWGVWLAMGIDILGRGAACVTRWVRKRE
ncbi:MAG TPA: MATE family efflux transporter [Oscillospiraceae bacterium]|nr:MATE family efflux transporter [Oscillospiraceae bacterium]